MKVKDLIELLKEHDPELDVLMTFHGSDDGFPANDYCFSALFIEIKTGEIVCQDYLDDLKKDEPEEFCQEDYQKVFVISAVF